MAARPRLSSPCDLRQLSDGAQTRAGTLPARPFLSGFYRPVVIVSVADRRLRSEFVTIVVYRQGNMSLM